MKFNDFIVSEEKVRLDPKCWTGKKIGNPKTKMKGGVRARATFSPLSPPSPLPLTSTPPSAWMTSVR